MVEVCMLSVTQPSCIPKTLKPFIPLPSPAMKDRRALSSYGSVYIPPHHRLRSVANFNNSPSPFRAKPHENPTHTISSLQPPFTERVTDKARSRFVSAYDDTVSEEGSDHEFELPSVVVSNFLFFFLTSCIFCCYIRSVGGHVCERGI